MSMFLEDFPIEKKDKYILILITAFSLILTCYYINFNQNLGIYCSDVYVYLLNALYYAGTNIHSTKSIYLSPVVCFLTSLIFDLGYVDKVAIFIVTGILAIIGNIGLYLLLRLKFNNLLSNSGKFLFKKSAFSFHNPLCEDSASIPNIFFNSSSLIFLHPFLRHNPTCYTATGKHILHIVDNFFVFCLFFGVFYNKKTDLLIAFATF